jgi:hypothetical protein
MSTAEVIAEQTVELRFVARDGGSGAVGSITIPVKTAFASAK